MIREPSYLIPSKKNLYRGELFSSRPRRILNHYPVPYTSTDTAGTLEFRLGKNLGPGRVECPEDQVQGGIRSGLVEGCLDVLRAQCE